MLLQDNLLNSKRDKKSDRKKGPYVKDNSFDDRDSDSSSQRRAIVKNLELSDIIFFDLTKKLIEEITLLFILIKL